MIYVYCPVDGTRIPVFTPLEGKSGETCLKLARCAKCDHVSEVRLYAKSVALEWCVVGIA